MSWRAFLAACLVSASVLGTPEAQAEPSSIDA